MSIAAVIPASDLDADEMLQTVAALPADWLVVVSANGATREMLDAARHLADSGRVALEVCEHVLGKVEAVRRGIAIALDDTATEVVVQLDGDLKQPPQQAVLLAHTLVTSSVDLIVANRYADQDLAAQQHRHALSQVMSDLLSSLTEIRVSDTVCGMRGYTRHLARVFVRELRAFGYGLEIEQLLIAAETGAAVNEIGVLSNHQANATAAEKLEDNFCAIQSRASTLGASPLQSALLCSYIVMLKRRCSVGIDFPSTSATRKVMLEYLGDSASVPDAYAASFV
jgi:hypothetical protein